MPKPKTMVLRFRDLAARTIEEHRKYITAKGYVWWGWWNKPSEKIPRDTFAAFSEVIAQGKGLPIFLLDSGIQQLYRASLTEIWLSPTDAAIPSKEKDASPEYYRNMGYRAWFRLSGEIAEASASEIRAYSYCEVPEFSDSTESTLYNEKRVFSIQEMLERKHKTIWFLQPYTKEHRDHSVSPAPARIPANFAPEPLLTNSSYLIQLSDLHFSHKNHAFALGDDQIHLSLAKILIDDLQGYKPGSAPAALLLTGDFTWTGTAAEFDLALDLINKLQSAFDLKPEQIILIPGNHDIQWSTQPAEKYRATQKVTRPAEEAELNYRKFYTQVVGVPPNEYLSMGRRYILGNYLAVDVVGLNSCRLEQKHFAGYGFVQKQQLDKAANEMRWGIDEPRVHYRLLALHHHVVPVAPAEEIRSTNPSYSITVDAGQIVHRALRLGVDLILHGHQHHPFAASMTRSTRSGEFPRDRSIAIHGAGSAGVLRKHVGPGGKNSYTIYSFDEGGVTLEIRSTSETEAGFDSDWKCRFLKNKAGGLRAVDDSQRSDSQRLVGGSRNSLKESSPG
jgi:calcineurin-like phosphoesterase family protein